MSLDKRIEGAVDTILSCCNSALSDDEKQSYIKQEIKNAYSIETENKYETPEVPPTIFDDAPDVDISDELNNF